MMRTIVLAAALLAGLSSPALACKCAQRTLADYYGDAELVFIARAEKVSETGEPNPHRLVRFVLKGKPYRGDPTTLDHLATELSTASCGYPVEAGRLYIVFASRRAPGDTVAWFNTCDGTRSFDPRSDAGVQGFADVPAADILPRLSALRAAAATTDPRLSATPRMPAANDATARVVGLLEIPGLLDLEEGAAPTKTLAVYAEPEAGGAPPRQVRRAGDLVVKEYAYEQAGAVVEARRPGWFRLELSDGKDGWVRAADVGLFHPVAELIVNRLNYLTRHWDGWIWPSPGAGYPQAGPPRAAGDEQPAKVVATEVIGGTLWLQIELLDRSPCDDGTAKPTHAGWIPAYAPDGEPTAWFYSRGC